MSIPEVPTPSRLIIGVLYSDKQWADHALPRLTEALGPIEDDVGPLPFDFTDYYQDELGPGIQRRLWVFERLIDRGELASVKRLTNRIEYAYTEQGRRKINLDPGLLSLENFVLATGKNRAHRIYLRDGIFADLTLIFRGGSYRPLEWTYPDYATSEMRRILGELREKYKCRIQESLRKKVP